MSISPSICVKVSDKKPRALSYCTCSAGPTQLVQPCTKAPTTCSARRLRNVPSHAIASPNEFEPSNTMRKIRLLPSTPWTSKASSITRSLNMSLFFDCAALGSTASTTAHHDLLHEPRALEVPGLLLNATSPGSSRPSRRRAPAATTTVYTGRRMPPSRVATGRSIRASSSRRHDS